MNTLNYFVTPVLAFILSLTIGPLLRKVALMVKLTDKPNHRKVHSGSIPLVGGVLVFISSAITLSLTALSFSHYAVLFSGSFFLLLIGVIDDKMDLKAAYKFMVQLILAYFVYVSGIKIDSFYGILGIYSLPEYWQIFITLLVITGTVNAFNLTDGIDGLAASLAILGFGVYSILALLFGQSELALIFLTLVGALLGFLRFNLSSKSKLFMGDAGSLFIGFILVVGGIILIQHSNTIQSYSAFINRNSTIAIVISVLLLPVIDSLRVYQGRLKNGNSVFKADKTHLHHLLLALNIKHFKATLLIVLLSLFFLVLSIYMSPLFSLTLILFFLLIIYAFFSNLMSLNRDLVKWSERIKSLERNTSVPKNAGNLV